MNVLIVLNIILTFILILCICKIWFRPPMRVEIPVPIKVPVDVPRIVPVEVQRPQIVHQPEFRPPPLKEWKPGEYQQMGLLTGPDGHVRPLYGRESRTHNDRYYYYTTTPGEQIYPVPITYQTRDCSDDIGCPEFYGNETVTVFGTSGDYNVKMYPNRQWRS